MADECTAVMDGLVAPPFCPRFPLTLALSHGGEKGLLAVVEGLRPSPLRAYPALLSVLWAPLARAPFAGRKGQIRMCLIDLRVVVADLSWSSGGGASGLFFPFDEGEAEVDARARRAGEGDLGFFSKHRRVCGLRANRLMVDKKGPVPPTSPDRLPSGRRNDVAARHHLVLQPRVSTVAVSTRRSGGDLWDKGSDRSDLERASPASGRFTNRPYVASPSLCERDGIFRLACKAEPALTLRIRTLQLQAPS